MNETEWERLLAEVKSQFGSWAVLSMILLIRKDLDSLQEAFASAQKQDECPNCRAHPQWTAAMKRSRNP